MKDYAHRTKSEFKNHRESERSIFNEIGLLATVCHQIE
jgi:hypothetical protein